MELNFVTGTQFFIAINGCLLALGLIALRLSGRNANLFLVALFVLFVMMMIGEFAFHARSNLVLSEMRAAWPFLFGPVLYFYFRRFADPRIRLKWRDASHLLPFLAAVALLWIESYYFWIVSIHYYASAAAVSILAYSAAAIWVSVNRRAGLSRRRKLWLVIAGLNCLALVGLLSVSTYFACDLELASPGREIRYALLGTIILLMNLMVFGGLWEPGVVMGPASRRDDPPRDQDVARLVDALEIKRAYLDPGLTLERFAELAGQSPRQISHLIRSHYGYSFPQLLSRLRVEEACRLIKADPGAVLLDIAFASGFNSKTSFNRAFREVTSQTPSAFRATYLEETHE